MPRGAGSFTAAVGSCIVPDTPRVHAGETVRLAARTSSCLVSTWDADEAQAVTDNAAVHVQAFGSNRSESLVFEYQLGRTTATNQLSINVEPIKAKVASRRRRSTRQAIARAPDLSDIPEAKEEGVESVVHSSLDWVRMSRDGQHNGATSSNLASSGVAPELGALQEDLALNADHSAQYKVRAYSKAPRV